MSTLYLEFAASVRQASHNAVVIFLISLACVLAYVSLDRIPETWRSFAKLAAWMYAVVVIGITIASSMEG